MVPVLATDPLLELEVNETLQVCCDELANDEDGGHAGEDHERQRHLGEPDAVTTFEVFRKPMDKHANDEDKDDAPVLPSHLRHQRPIPLPPDLVHHVFGRAPRLLIGLRRIKIRSAAEEETSESDEYERHKN